VVDVNMPDGQLIIALLGARSSRTLRRPRHDSPLA
jgi:hypothetical protein